MLEKDLLSAYANASVKVLKELEKGWYRDTSLGECYKTKLKVEVIPDPNFITPQKGKSDNAEQEMTRLMYEIAAQEKPHIIHALIGTRIIVSVYKPPAGDFKVMLNNRDIGQYLLSESKSAYSAEYSFEGTLDQLNIHVGINKVMVKYANNLSLEFDVRLTEKEKMNIDLEKKKKREEHEESERIYKEREKRRNSNRVLKGQSGF